MSQVPMKRWTVELPQSYHELIRSFARVAGLRITQNDALQAILDTTDADKVHARLDEIRKSKNEQRAVAAVKQSLSTLSDEAKRELAAELGLKMEEDEQ